MLANTMFLRGGSAKPLTAGRLALGESLSIEGIREISACDLRHRNKWDFSAP